MGGARIFIFMLFSSLMPSSCLFSLPLPLIISFPLCLFLPNIFQMLLFYSCFCQYVRIGNYWYEVWSRIECGMLFGIVLFIIFFTLEEDSFTIFFSCSVNVFLFNYYYLQSKIIIYPISIAYTFFYLEICSTEVSEIGQNLI